MRDEYVNDEASRGADGLMLIAAAAGIGIEAIRAIRTPDHSHHGWTLPVLATVVIVKLLMSQRVRNSGADEQRPINTADRWQHLRDAGTSAAAFIGISVALLGGRDWEMADDWISLGAAAVMGYSGLTIVLSALRGSMHSRQRREIFLEIRTAVARIPEVLSIETLAVRKGAGTLWVTIQAQAMPSTPLSEVHAIIGRVTSAVRHAIPDLVHVLVHLEPQDPESGKGSPRLASAPPIVTRRCCTKCTHREHDLETWRAAKLRGGM